MSKYTNVDELLSFDKITDDEKQYCGEIAKKYRLPPKFAESFPEEPFEYWDIDVCNEWRKKYYVWRTNLDEYCKILKKEIHRDVYSLVEWLVPSIFRYCRTYKQYCSIQMVYEFVEDTITGSEYRFERHQGNCYDYQVREYSNLYTNSHNRVNPYLVFNTPFKMLKDKMELNEMICGEYSHLPHNQFKLKHVLSCSNTHARTDAFHKQRENTIKSNPGTNWKDLYKLEDYNFIKYTEIAKDINRMLCSVETKTIFNRVDRNSNMERDYTPYFTKINKTIGKRMKSTYVDEEYTGDITILDTDDILTILYHLTLKRFETSESDRDKYQTIIDNYLSRMDNTQIHDLCDVFEIKYNALDDKSILTIYVSGIFKRYDLLNSVLIEFCSDKNK